MKQLTFQGYSDDTFACSAPGIDVDHDNCANGEPISMLVTGHGRKIIVTGQYCPGAATGWLIGVAPGADDPDEEPLPDWPMRIMPGDMSYSSKLVIDAPDDVTVALVREGDEEADGD